MALLALPVVLVAILLLAFPVAALTSGRSGRALFRTFAASIGWALLSGFIWVFCAKIGASSGGGSEAVSVVLAAEGFFVGGLIGCAPGAGLFVQFVRKLRSHPTAT